MKLHVSHDPDESNSIVAGWMISYIKEVLTKHNRFTISLSGGSTPKKLYQLLASDSYKNKINWKQIHVFWGDERVVPFTDKNNNAKMAFDELLSHVPVPKEQIHIMPTDIDPQAAAEAYGQLLHQYFDKQLYSFDLVLLGLGDNSHTLSLFPGYDDIIFEKENWVRGFRLHEENINRITLTAPIVNKAGRIAYLVNGSGKTDALQHVIYGKYDPTLYPAQVIKPLNAELYWFIDKEAAAGLQSIV
ncbi:MAG: 6-phosphogluconolactonase [Chitinophagaceae bacterium]